MNKGRKVKIDDGIEMHEENLIKSLDEGGSCKFLAVLQADEVKTVKWKRRWRKNGKTFKVNNT